MTDKILEAVKVLGGDIRNVSSLYDNDEMIILTKYGRYMAVPSWYEKCESSEWLCTISEFNTAAAEWLKEAYMHNAALDLEWDINNSFNYDGEEYLFRNSDTGVYVDSDDEDDCDGDYTLICKSQEFIDYCTANKQQSQVETPEEKEAFDMIEEKQKADWNGEGLPPVGSEYIDESSQLCVCVGYTGNGEFVIGEAVEHPTVCDRPMISLSGIGCINRIKSPRDKFVESLRKDLVAADYPFNLLYDWLKSLTPEQKKEFGI